MSLNIPISPSTEAKLRELAAAAGEPVESFASRMLDRLIGQTNGSTGEHKLSEAEAQRRRAALEEWMKLRRATGHPLDDSRESIYEGRGE